MIMSETGKTARPRVLHVTTAHHADDVRIFERECRSLADTGRYDVYLAAAGAPASSSGVTLIPLSPAPATRTKRFVSGPRKALGLSRALSVDLWHFHDPELLPVALKVASSGTPVIWDAHEDYLAQFTDDGAKNWLPSSLRGTVRRALRLMLETVDRRAAGIVAATPTIASRYSNPRTVVVGNEARLSDFQSCAPDFSAQRLLFTGGVGPAALFEEVVEAVASTPSVSLAVAGRAPNPFLWRAAEARLPGRIEHLGWLDRHELCRAISQSTLGLATYADTDAYAVAAPTKLFEFCAAGLPVIASPNAANASLIAEGAGGFLAEGFTAEALARAIREALGNREVWQRVSTTGRAWAMRAGSWEQSERRLLDLYARILGS